MSFVKQALLVVVLVILAGAGFYAFQSREGAGSGPAAETAQRGSGGQRQGGEGGGAGGNLIPGLTGGGGAVNVILAPVATTAAGDTVRALGTAKAARSVVLFPQGTGMVREILFQPGQEVEEGAILLRLEDDTESVAVERAGLALDQANEALTRAQTLSKSKTISSAALIEAQTAAGLAEVDLKDAQIALDRRTVKAPFAGTVGLTDVTAGDLVTNTTAITTLEDISTVRVGFEVPERYAARIELGQEIQASPQGTPVDAFAGTVSAIDNRVDEATRTLKLEAELANEDRALKAGMALSVTLEFPPQDELSVPSLALQWDRRGSYVWKVADEVAHRAAVTILKRESGIVVVSGEIAAGETIVVEGTQRLREGAQVNVVDESPAMAGEEPAEAPEAPPAVSESAAPARRG